MNGAEAGHFGAETPHAAGHTERQRHPYLANPHQSTLRRRPPDTELSGNYLAAREFVASDGQPTQYGKTGRWEINA